MSENNKYDFSKIFDKVLNRPIYKQLTLDLLKSTPDEDLTQLVIDNIQCNNERKSDAEIYAVLSPGQKVIYSTYTLETQIFNAGFEGFYLNTNCGLNQFLEGDLIAIGANSLAEIVGKANEIATLVETENAEPERLYPLDIEFQKQIEQDNLDARRVTYIKENITEFISK